MTLEEFRSVLENTLAEVAKVDNTVVSIDLAMADRKRLLQILLAYQQYVYRLGGDGSVVPGDLWDASANIKVTGDYTLRSQPDNVTIAGGVRECRQASGVMVQIKWEE